MISSVLLAALAAACAATPASTPVRPYTCHEFSVDIPVENVTTVVPLLPEIENAYQATEYAVLLTTRQDPESPGPHPNLTTLTKTFTIVGDYCTPNKPGPKANTIQILTHGLGFDRSYWDFYPTSNLSDTQYSYVHAATTAGYSIISWNRLGISPSSLANPYTEIQATVELSLLISLTQLALTGSPSLHLSSPPTSILHIGHSWGSLLTSALATHAPNLTSAIILTGYTDTQLGGVHFLSSTSFHLASQNQPTRFPAAKYSNGYLTWPDALANQFSFLTYPAFSPDVLEQAESIKQPFALGELLSSAAVVSGEGSAFTGPVYYVLGEGDVIFCAGNCTGTVGVEVNATRNAWPDVEDLKVDILPGLGHGLNLHLGAKEEVYEGILGWVGERF